MAKSAKQTLHRDQWLKQALDVLFSSGISSVKVETLARELDVTKGSFYWHFENRDELLHHMVDWWRDNQITFIDSLDVQTYQRRAQFDQIRYRLYRSYR